MPRQDVPYGGAICRLKERIAEIWDKLGEKLHSINGVEGDGAGNVEITSGNDAVVITNDQIGHRIEVSLDSSKLPAASVSSVNGQTGAVRLDAVNILSDGDSNVQADIDLNKAAINDCFDSITSEQTARQNADATLQTNINAVKASIPEMSATPDPYKGVERDAQGRAFAADPAAGVTDKTLVTANWVSQTGDASPNNLIHKTGDETKYGKFTLGDILTLYNESWETAPVTIHKWAFDSTTPPTRFETINGGSVIKDVNDRDIWNVRAYRDTDGRDVLSIDGFAYDNTSGYLHYEIGPNGYRKIDTDGRMQAADPAAGATDKTLVTANWISQSGDTAPNNLMHRNGNETVPGIKTFDYNSERMVIVGPTSSSDFWVKIARWTDVNLRYGIIMTVTTQYFRDVNFYGKLMFGCWDRTNFGHLDLYAFYDWSAKFKLTWDGSEIALWFHNTSGKASQNLVIFVEAEWAGSDKTKAVIPIAPQDQVAQTEPDWASYVNVLNCDFKRL